MAVHAAPNANWVLPTRDEWYKAAYYKGGGTERWLLDVSHPKQRYAQQRSLLDGYEQRQFLQLPHGRQHRPSELSHPGGSICRVAGPYSTFDQGGDVWQFEETTINGVYRETRGGSFTTVSSALNSSSFNGLTPGYVAASVGIRVAYVPEPTTIGMLLVAAAGGVVFVKRHVSKD